jgi:hypothetical protein
MSTIVCLCSICGGGVQRKELSSRMKREGGFYGEQKDI